MPPAVGATAPPFSLPGEDGNLRSLDDLTAAGPVVLAFFKTSCPVCTMEFPVLGELARRLGDALPVVAVSQDPLGSARAWLDERGFAGPVLDDSTGGFAASAAYGLQTVPTVVMVGGDGTVARVLQGWDRDRINELAAELGTLAGRDGSPLSTPEDGLPPFRPG